MRTKVITKAKARVAELRILYPQTSVVEFKRLITYAEELEVMVASLQLSVKRTQSRSKK